MKVTQTFLRLILFLVFSAGLAACSQIKPIAPEDLARNLGPILKIEKRLDQVKYYSKMLGNLGEMKGENADDLKAHHDIYYVYYVAANVQLARGDMEAYLAHVKLAERELDLMESIVKDRLTRLAESKSRKKSHFSRPEL